MQCADGAGTGPASLWSQEPAHTQGKAPASACQATSCVFQTTYDPVAAALSARKGTLVSFPDTRRRRAAPHRDATNENAAEGSPLDGVVIARLSRIAARNLLTGYRLPKSRRDTTNRPVPSSIKLPGSGTFFVVRSK